METMGLKAPLQHPYWCHRMEGVPKVRMTYWVWSNRQAGASEVSGLEPGEAHSCPHL